VAAKKASKNRAKERGRKEYEERTGRSGRGFERLTGLADSSRPIEEPHLLEGDHMTIAPAPQFPEDPGTVYERKYAAAIPGQRGPLRFEEGVATDTDVPSDFQKGIMQGLMSPARPP
jgi:hypothetical protein